MHQMHGFFFTYASTQLKTNSKYNSTTNFPLGGQIKASIWIEEKNISSLEIRYSYYEFDVFSFTRL